MPELGTSGSAGGPGRATSQVYPLSTQTLASMPSYGFGRVIRRQKRQPITVRNAPGSLRRPRNAGGATWSE
jgi:hypothetical protein